MENRKVERSRLVVKKEKGEAPTAPAPAPAPAPPDNDQEKVLLIFGARVSVHAQNQGGGERQVPVAAGMGNRNVERSRVVVMEKDEAPPAPPGDDQEKYRSILQEKLYRTRLELQKMLALSADADEILSRLTAEAHKVKQEKEEEYMKHKALQAELHARRNTQAMMTPPTYGSPAAAFAGRSCYGNPAPFRRMTTQEQYYAQAAGVCYCFASSPPPRMFDSFVPAAATGIMPGTARKKRSANEFDLVAQEMLRLSRKKEEVVKAPIHEEDNDAVSGTTSSEETVSDVGLIEVGGGECSLADSAASKKQ